MEGKLRVDIDTSLLEKIDVTKLNHEGIKLLAAVNFRNKSKEIFEEYKEEQETLEKKVILVFLCLDCILIGALVQVIPWIF